MALEDAGQHPEEDDYCSETDSESGSDYSVTQTQIAITDGPLEEDDASNPLVSRIGGRAAWLPNKSLPPSSVSHCEHCKEPMELLVQIFAPLDDSPYDRIVLVWGCARTPCQKAGLGW
jgi:pre-rRNA-processing protein TSR4